MNFKFTEIILVKSLKLLTGRNANRKEEIQAKQLNT